MRLTRISREEIPLALNSIRARIDPGSWSARAFERVSDSAAFFDAEYDTAAHRKVALDLARRLRIPTLDKTPAEGFSWDGSVIWARSESCVLIHEIAHWQVAPPARRHYVDFGLGAGPETGRVEEANGARCVSDAVKEREELLASLLGIFWEAALGQPAIHAFIEQNWLEAWDRPVAASQFSDTANELFARGLIDRDGVPTMTTPLPRQSQ
jgi:hypothetical protein